MTPEQFETIAMLLRSRSHAREAARLVLVENMRNVDAANAAGTTPQVSSDAVRRFKAAEQAIRAVF